MVIEKRDASWTKTGLSFEVNVPRNGNLERMILSIEAETQTLYYTQKDKLIKTIPFHHLLCIQKNYHKINVFTLYFRSGEKSLEHILDCSVSKRSLCGLLNIIIKSLEKTIKSTKGATGEKKEDTEAKNMEYLSSMLNRRATEKKDQYTLPFIKLQDLHLPQCKQIKKGFVKKKAGAFRTKSRRYAILTDSRLLIYKNHDTKKFPLNAIYLSHLDLVKGGPNQLTLQNRRRKYELNFQLPIERDEWLLEIEAEIHKADSIDEGLYAEEQKAVGSFASLIKKEERKGVVQSLSFRSSMSSRRDSISSYNSQYSLADSVATNMGYQKDFDLPKKTKKRSGTVITDRRKTTTKKPKTKRPKKVPMQRYDTLDTKAFREAHEKANRGVKKQNNLSGSNTPEKEQRKKPVTTISPGGVIIKRAPLSNGRGKKKIQRGKFKNVLKVNLMAKNATRSRILDEAANKPKPQTPRNGLGRRMSLTMLNQLDDDPVHLYPTKRQTVSVSPTIDKRKTKKVDSTLKRTVSQSVIPKQKSSGLTPRTLRKEQIRKVSLSKGGTIGYSPRRNKRKLTIDFDQYTLKKKGGTLLSPRSKQDRKRISAIDFSPLKDTRKHAVSIESEGTRSRSHSNASGISGISAISGAPSSAGSEAFTDVTSSESEDQNKSALSVPKKRRKSDSRSDRSGRSTQSNRSNRSNQSRLIVKAVEPEIIENNEPSEPNGVVESKGYGKQSSEENVEQQDKTETSKWSTEDVIVWLESIGLSKLAPLFSENLVDGEMLLDLSDEDLQDELGLTKLQRRRTRREIEKLR